MGTTTSITTVLFCYRVGLPLDARTNGEACVLPDNRSDLTLDLQTKPDPRLPSVLLAKRGFSTFSPFSVHFFRPYYCFRLIGPPMEERLGRRVSYRDPIPLPLFLPCLFFFLFFFDFLVPPSCCFFIRILV